MLTVRGQSGMDVHVLFVAIKGNKPFDGITYLALVSLHVVGQVSPLDVKLQLYLGELFATVGARFFRVGAGMMLLQKGLRGEHF